MVRVSIGQSQELNGFVAGRDAAHQALVDVPNPGWRRLRRPLCALIFAHSGYDQNQVAAGVAAVLGASVPVVGCSTETQITSQGATFHSVVMMILWAGSDLAVVPVFVPDVSRDAVAAARRLGRVLLDRLPGAAAFAGVVRAANRTVFVRPYTLMLFAGGRSGEMSEFVDTLSTILGPAFQILGGLTGDTLDRTQSCQYCNGAAHTDAVVGLALIHRTPASIGLGHGCRPCSESMMVTRAEGPVLHELNGHPALELFFHQFRSTAVMAGLTNIPPGAQPGMWGGHPWSAAAHSPTFRQASAGLDASHPSMGIVEPNGSYRIRQLLHARADGAILSAAAVPQGLAVRWMTCSGAGAIAAMRHAAQEALIGLGHARPVAALMLYPSAYVEQGDLEGANAALAAVQSVIGPQVPILGFATRGEIASTLNANVELHNLMNVLYLIGS